MFLQRSAVAVARRAAVTPVLRRSFATTSAIRRESGPPCVTGPIAIAIPTRGMGWHRIRKTPDH